MTDHNPAENRPRHPKPADFKPDPVFAKGHKWAGTPRCQAWRPRLGRQCSNRAKPRPGGGHPAFPDTHMRVCRMDGGDSPIGIASPHWKGNGRDRYVPPALLPTYQQALERGDLLSGMRTLALLAGREETLLRWIDSGELGSAWQGVREQLTRFQQAARDPDLERGKRTAQEALQEMERLVAVGTRDAEAWEGLLTVWEQQRRTVETEMRRQEKARTLIPIEDVLWHIRRLMEINRESILEFEDLPARSARKLLQVIADRYAGVLGDRGARRRPEESDGDRAV